MNEIVLYLKFIIMKRLLIIMLPLLFIAWCNTQDNIQKIECYPKEYVPIIKVEFIDKYIECNEREDWFCVSAQINSWQVWYSELVWLQDSERCKYGKVVGDVDKDINCDMFLKHQQ